MADIMYQYKQTQQLESSSLTVEWLPEMNPGSQDYSMSCAMFGTFSVTKNRLIFSKVKIPKKRTVECDHSSTLSSIRLKINHLGGIYRARHMPQSPCVVATGNLYDDLLVFHHTEHLEGNEDEFQPDLRLPGHKSSAYALDWSPHLNGILVSGAADCSVRLWDIKGMCLENRTLEPLTALTGHVAPVKTVVWHPTYKCNFATSGMDMSLMLWDLRRPKPVSVTLAHSQSVNSISFNPFIDMVFATGSSDKSVRIWDVRKLTKSLGCFHWHREDVVQVQWSPIHKNILATAGKDNVVQVIDLNNKRPETVFVHTGHRNRINEFAWHPTIPWMFASVSSDKTIQYWQINPDILPTIKYTHVTRQALKPYHDCRKC